MTATQPPARSGNRSLALIALSVLGWLILVALAPQSVSKFAFYAPIYLTPSWVAFARGAKNRWPTLVVNAAFGWTIIGWFVALAMAVGEKRS